MDNHHHCKKCGKKVKEESFKTHHHSDDDHHITKKHTPSKKSSTGAILARTDDNMTVNGKIYFNVGIGNNRSFRVTDDGAEFVFTKDGFYQLTFRGKISSTGTLIFDRTPSVKKSQRQFSEFRFGETITEITTMLPFQKDYRLTVRFESSQSGVLESGAQIEIIRVDDL